VLSVVLEGFIDRQVVRKMVEPLMFPAIKRCSIGCYNIILYYKSVVGMRSLGSMEEGEEMRFRSGSVGAVNRK
jgi:hypothetical protein